MRRRTYIAGPMRGLPLHNHPAFIATAALFRELGHEVVNPVEVCAEMGGPEAQLPPEEFLRADLGELLTCNGIALLEGWEKSVGARCEAAVAVSLGFDFYHGTTGAQMAEPAVVEVRGGYRGPRPAAWYLCTICGRNPVDVEEGFDTCASCSRAA